MKIDLMAGGLALRDVQTLARDTKAAGYDGLVFTESGRTAYLSVAAAALAVDGLDLATGIAVAFPRSPVVTASTAWELAEASGGRFRLGLGSQVKAHVERRYGVDFDPPGPRLRDYVLAVRAVFAAYAGDAALSHQGPYYRHTLLPPGWSPGRIDVPPPPIDISAVNPWMLRMAGEVADGIHVHPLHTPTYLRDTLAPNVAAGAATAGRDPAAVALLVPCFTAFGDTEAARAPWREAARTQVAFYGSTPNYAFVFDQVGGEGTTARIRERQKAGDIAGMAACVTDEVLSHFLVEGDADGIAAGIRSRYAGTAQRVILYFAGRLWREDPTAFRALGEVARSVSEGS
jgi:probable F420-dependent oxidoreductase